MRRGSDVKISRSYSWKINLSRKNREIVMRTEIRIVMNFSIFECLYVFGIHYIVINLHKIIIMIDRMLAIGTNSFWKIKCFGYQRYHQNYPYLLIQSLQSIKDFICNICLHIIKFIVFHNSIYFWACRLWILII